jgi:DNA-binding MarR family transcriptional regulator
MTDLGETFSRLREVIVEREAPILAEHGLTMWEYVILTSIDREPGQSQRALATSSRRDATRLIRHLDDLAGRGLVRRDVDSADRRRSVVNLTDDGEARLRATRTAIRRMEDDLLDDLPAEQRTQLRATLEMLVRGL